MHPIDPDTFRLVSAVVGGLAGGMLAWRLIGWWRVIHLGVRVLGVLLLSTLVIAAVGQLELRAAGAPLTYAGWLILAHRVAVLAAALTWHRWAGTGGARG